MSRLFLLALCACLAVHAEAAAKKETKPKAAATAAAESHEKAPAAKPEAVGETDVIGSKEAPAVFNIVPWKDKNAVLPKKELSTSILRETLQPLDREVLQREILFQQGLNRQ